jgi:hypothetical protein
LRARLKRPPKLRHEHLAAIERLYPLQVPTRFRLGGVEGAKDRTEFGLREHRITSGWLYAEDWNSPDHREHGLSVARFVFAVKDGKLLMRWSPIAAISPQAIGRWFERSGLRDHDALIRRPRRAGACGRDRDDTDAIGWRVVGERGSTRRMTASR